MTLQNPKAIFDEVRRLIDRPLTQREVDRLNIAIGDAVDGPEITAPSKPVKPSEQAIRLMHQFEGCERRRSDGRLEAYPDPGSKDGNPWTIGWGSTGPGITRGTIWTQEQADARFQEDLNRFALGVVRLLGDARTSQAAFDSFVCLAYNIGLQAFGNSTLLRKHKEGDFEGAAAQFDRWVYNDGRLMKGLQKRRAAEAALYRGQA